MKEKFLRIEVEVLDPTSGPDLTQCSTLTEHLNDNWDILSIVQADAFLGKMIYNVNLVKN